MNKVQALLACSHTVRLHVNSSAARLRSETYCRFDGFQPIVKVFPEEWRVLCADCQYGRWEGQSLLVANRTCDIHMRRRKTHRAFAVYDTITATGGTNRQKLILDYLTSTQQASRLIKSPVPEEPNF